MKANNLILIISLILLTTASIAYAVTLTADATSRVDSPSVALGEICLYDAAAGACTDKRGEVLFGNVNVHSLGGDTIGLVIVQFGGNLYRSITTSPVNMVRGTTRDGAEFTASSLDIPENMVDYEIVSLAGLQGKLSWVRPDGSEVYSTGEMRTLSHPGKTDAVEDIAPGEFFISYDGLVLEDTDTSRQVMTAGDYRDLVIIINQPGGVKEEYRLVQILSTSSFDWTPSTEVPK